MSPAGWEPWPESFPEPLTVRLVRDDKPRRCHCGRPVSEASTCGCCCCECDDVADTARVIAAAMDRHPSGKAIDRPRYPRPDGGPSLREYLQSKGER
jgi:hypothetical protein